MEDEIISKLCVLEMVLHKLGKTGEWSWEQLAVAAAPLVCEGGPVTTINCYFFFFLYLAKNIYIKIISLN